MTSDWSQQINHLYQQKQPFFFIIDYKGEYGEVLPIQELEENEIFFALEGQTNAKINTENTQVKIQAAPISYDCYLTQFSRVKAEIKAGNSYLLNLCTRTHIDCNQDLSTIFHSANARFKLLYRNQFVHFSPEIFIKITDNQIDTFPMKGTINANVAEAEILLRNNEKEKIEQQIITDLLRNDLSLVANQVKVERFRYIEEVKRGDGALLQCSSHISGKIKDAFVDKPGNIFQKMLPAGSVTGAPKKKTLEIIEAVEDFDRGFYTGVWGIYDGQKITSCVIIRYIEKVGEQFYYKSGGGITAMSNPENEYQELIEKIYVPIS